MLTILAVMFSLAFGPLLFRMQIRTHLVKWSAAAVVIALTTYYIKHLVNVEVLWSAFHMAAFTLCLWSTYKGKLWNSMLMALAGNLVYKLMYLLSIIVYSVVSQFSYSDILSRIEHERPVLLLSIALMAISYHIVTRYRLGFTLLAASIHCASKHVKEPKLVIIFIFSLMVFVVGSWTVSLQVVFFFLSVVCILLSLLVFLLYFYKLEMQD